MVIYHRPDLLTVPSQYMDQPFNRLLWFRLSRLLKLIMSCIKSRQMTYTSEERYPRNQTPHATVYQWGSSADRGYHTIETSTAAAELPTICEQVICIKSTVFFAIHNTNILTWRVIDFHCFGVSSSSSNRSSPATISEWEWRLCNVPAQTLFLGSHTLLIFFPPLLK